MKVRELNKQLHRREERRREFLLDLFEKIRAAGYVVSSLVDEEQLHDLFNIELPDLEVEHALQNSQNEGRQVSSNVAARNEIEEDDEAQGEETGSSVESDQTRIQAATETSKSEIKDARVPTESAAILSSGVADGLPSSKKSARADQLHKPSAKSKRPRGV